MQLKRKLQLNTKIGSDFSFVYLERLNALTDWFYLYSIIRCIDSILERYVVGLCLLFEILLFGMLRETKDRGMDQ